MSPTKMLGTDGTKALAPSTVQRLSARTSSGTPLHWGQVPTSLLHVLTVKSHPTPEYTWEGVELAVSSSNEIEHLSLPYDPATRRLFGVPVVATVSRGRRRRPRPGHRCGRGRHLSLYLTLRVRQCQSSSSQRLASARIALWWDLPVAILAS